MAYGCHRLDREITQRDVISACQRLRDGAACARCCHRACELLAFETARQKCRENCPELCTLNFPAGEVPVLEVRR
ncbi:MAG: hypothetical protein SNJ74_11475 [Fimbriimonadaceae bacterium]